VTASAREQALEVAEDLAAVGPIEVTRFFGGAGLTCDGRQFAFVMKGKLYLRVDDTTRARFEAAAAEPFSYWNGPHQVMVASYYEVPAAVAADLQALTRWATDARDAAASTPRRTARKR
jgi:TfoX/Sxy family transcriptional regulator of competence genes